MNISLKQRYIVTQTQLHFLRLHTLLHSCGLPVTQIVKFRVTNVRGIGNLLCNFVEIVPSEVGHMQALSTIDFMGS